MKDTGDVQKIYIEKYMFMTPLSRKKKLSENLFKRRSMSELLKTKLK